jgi:selenide,water dikinase
MLDATTCRSVVLIGGGHSHVQVLKILASEIHKCEGVRVTLISDNPVAWYSGMLPACIAGLYKPKELQIDLQALAHWYGIYFQYT